MKSVTTSRFRKCYEDLPENIKENAKKAYQLWKTDPYHASLQFKQVHDQRPIFSVRIGLSYRAFGIQEGETIIWFWIGSHEEYNHLIKNF